MAGKKIEDMTAEEYQAARLRAWCELNPTLAADEIERLRDVERKYVEMKTAARSAAHSG